MPDRSWRGFHRHARSRGVRTLERMAILEPHHVGRLRIQPEMGELRSDPRLAALRTRFNLPSQ